MNVVYLGTNETTWHKYQLLNILGKQQIFRMFGKNQALLIVIRELEINGQEYVVEVKREI